MGFKGLLMVEMLLDLSVKGWVEHIQPESVGEALEGREVVKNMRKIKTLGILERWLPKWSHFTPNPKLQVAALVYTKAEPSYN